MNINTRIVQVAQSLVDADYCLGDNAKGFDCLSMLWAFYGGLGVELPKTHEGFSDENYAEKWKAGEGREEFYEYLHAIGEEVDANYIIAGDLLIFEDKQPFPGIYLGSDHMLCAFEKGVRVVPFHLFRRALVEARRCLPS